VLEFCGGLWRNAAMQAAAKHRLTAREYLALERKAETKSEFLHGEVFAMTGGTRRHSLIATNLAGELRTLLKGKPCQVFNRDMRLKIEATGLCTSPDVQVACGKRRFEDAPEDVLLNPRIIFEVLSDSTSAWDRGQKFWHYRHLESLAEYVLVAQDLWLVERYTRQPEGSWVLETVEGAKGVLALKSIRCRVPLKEIYANTRLDPKSMPEKCVVGSSSPFVLRPRFCGEFRGRGRGTRTRPEPNFQTRSNARPATYPVQPDPKP
jgi:Uma2 family endonuclease